jgi:hypothetical protein
MSGGRIEIPMDEYKGMKERVEELEKTLVSKDKEIEVLKEKSLLLQTRLEDIATIPLFERIFKWGETVNNILSDD